MKLRDFEYSVAIEKYTETALGPVIIRASISHPDGEEFDIYFYEHECNSSSRTFWSSDYAHAHYNNDLQMLDELEMLYARIYSTRIIEILNNEVNVSRV